jgi:signal transduction histidine kinase
VQRAAEAHGGAVFVDEPRPGWSTTFTLYVPETEENGDPAAPPPGPERGEP